MRLIPAIALAIVAANGAVAEDFAFGNSAARMVIRSDGIVSSLIEMQSHKELLGPPSHAFAAVRKAGQFFPASEVVRRGDVLHVIFGASGVDADFRITAGPNSIVVELSAFHGAGIQEIRLMQLNVSLVHPGGVFGLRWDNEFAVCLMGLSAQVDSRTAEQELLASVYPEYSMQGERVALLVAPTPRFLEVVRTLELEFRLPSPTIQGTWTKLSEDNRSSYLFTDLTEGNADETIRYAKLGGFRYILAYSATWSASSGSYPINTHNFPRGEASLKAVIDKCHAAGLKVGMHMLTSLVGKDDPLVTPKPSPGLLKDAETTLGPNMSESATEITAASAVDWLRLESGGYGVARDILIDDEIVHYDGRINGVFVRCVRGFAGTKPTAHTTGARIYHLVEREGAYLADLKTPLKNVISDRVSGLIDRCGFDMIFFDGGEINFANGPPWYWLGPQQMQIWEKTKRELLVQGSGITGWTWHIFSRGASDDFSVLAVKEYLDKHKIPDYWSGYRDDFLPGELGWVGFQQYGPDHPATTPDEVEYYAVRMLALDAGSSYETNFDTLKANGRAGEIMTLLGQYERLRLSRAVPSAIRQQLLTDEWHMTRAGEFHPIRYDSQRVNVPGEIALRNEFAAQPLKFRLQVAPALASVGDPSNIPLVRAQTPVEAPPPDNDAILPGTRVQRLGFTRAARDEGKPKAADDTAPGAPLDLTKHRALAVRLDVEGLVSGSGEPPVLNLQLEDNGKNYRDYYVNLDFSGLRTVILNEPDAKRLLTELRPPYVNYPFKMAIRDFNYANVVALNLRWMRYTKGSGIRCRVSVVEALEEQAVTLRDIQISAGQASIVIPAAMKTGDYAEYWGDGTIRVFDRNGVTLVNSTVGPGPSLTVGENNLRLKAVGEGSIVFTAITLGK